MDDKAKAQHAARLLKDDVLQEAFNVVSGYHTALFTDATATDEQVLEARRMVLAINEVKAQLKRFVVTGQIAEKRDQDRAID